MANQSTGSKADVDWANSKGYSLLKMSSSEDNLSDDEDYIPEDHSLSDEDEDDTKDLDQTLKCSRNTNSESAIDKNKVDELWKNFKKDISGPESKTVLVEPSLVGVQDHINGEKTKGFNIQAKIPKSDTVVITQVYDFAGEDIKVTKEVKRDSVEAKKHFKQQTTANSSEKGVLKRSLIGSSFRKRSGGGIGSVLGKLGKKPKLSTLEKSKLDWNQYKEETGIEEELLAYNKGKQGYLEKVSFLERTEMRQFERERDMRLSQSSKR